MDGEDEVTLLLAVIRGSGGGNWCHESKDVKLALRPLNRVHAIQAKELL